MKKLICIFFMIIMILTLSACENGEKQEQTKEETNIENNEYYNDIGTTYPILFFENDILYYLKNSDESPLLVYEEQKEGRGPLGIFANPTDPNLVVCANKFQDDYFDQYYLDTTPYPEYITFTNIDLFRYGNYTPDGKYFFFVDNEWNMEFYEAQTRENFECAFEIDDILSINKNWILFEDNSSKFYYLSYNREENKNYISLADANTGYKRQLLDISDFEDWSWTFVFQYFKDNKVYFGYNGIQYELDVETEELKEINRAVGDKGENYTWWYDGTLTCRQDWDSESYTDYLDFGADTIKYTRTYDTFSGDYTNLFKLQNGKYVLQYTDSDKVANLCYYDGKNIKTLMRDNNYYFIQPLNNTELLLFETEPSGMNNLVIYEIETGNMSVIYKNFKGDKTDIIVTYDYYKKILYDEIYGREW